MWIITRLTGKMEVLAFETVAEWHAFVELNNWTYYSVRYSNKEIKK